MPDKSNMSLTVDVAVSGTVDAGGNLSVSAQYAMTASDPAPDPTMPPVVDSEGDINLYNLAFDNNNYKKNTDITFNLSGTITDANGDSVDFSFPSEISQAVTITKDNGGGNSQLTPSFGTSVQQLIIADTDDDGASYTYCMNIWALTDPPENGTSAPLDPNIVNR